VPRVNDPAQNLFVPTSLVGKTRRTGRNVAERNPKPTEITTYFKYPTTAYVFGGGGGNFHHKCNTSLESPFDGHIFDTVLMYIKMNS
jgi:hypothetical protein